MSAEDRRRPGILVTRPRGQGAGLVRVIEETGATPLEFPVIDFEALRDTGPAVTALAGLEAGDWVIPVSPTAMRFLNKLVADSGLDLGGVRFAAVGEGTAAAIREAGYEPAARPVTGDGAQALLDSGSLDDLGGRQALICRGLGGRRVLDEGLAAAGAEVTAIELYRRIPARTDPRRLSQWLAANAVDVITLSSAAAAEFLRDMVSAEDFARLATLPVVAPSSRVLKLAASQGLHGPAHVAANAGDEAMAEAALRAWRTRS